MTQGYLAIHLSGLGTGLTIFPPKPSYPRRLENEGSYNNLRQKFNDKGRITYTRTILERDDSKTAIELGGYFVLWTAFLVIMRGTGIGTDVSRQLVGSPQT